MAKSIVLTVEGTPIRLISENNEDFISLTDIAKRASDRTDQIITNWLRTRSTIEFLGVWESLNNVNFNPLNFEGIKNQAGTPTFVLTVTDWVTSTNAVGINAKAGRYGGTYAHKDIALEFCSWLSPAFRLYVIREFQRLKTEESDVLKLEWNLKRLLSKVNYYIHTDAVKTNLIPPRLQNKKLEGIIYASEADLLNIALFGLAAKDWKIQNPEAKGNQRDSATAEQLLVLANLENLNAEFIHQGMKQAERLQRLNEIAIHQMELLLSLPMIQQLNSGNNMLK
jgi:KilA-N domain